MKMGKLEKLFVNSPGHSQGVARHAEKLLRRVPVQPGQTYLDVGCGNGAAPIAIAQTFDLNVTGVDIDPEQIALAQEAAQGFADEEYDIVFTNKVTHHIPDWPSALAEMVRVLKVGGYLIYSDLSLPTPLARLGKALAGNWVGFPNRPALEAFRKQHGLTTVWRSARPFHFAAIYRKESRGCG